MSSTKVVSSSQDIQTAISRHNKLCILVGNLLDKNIVTKARKEVDVRRLHQTRKFTSMLECALTKLHNNGMFSNVSFINMSEYDTSHVNKTYHINVVCVYAGVMTDTGVEVNYMNNIMPNKAKKQVLITTEDKYVPQEYTCYYYEQN